MTDYNPPIEDLPIFDSSVFLIGDAFITQNQADKRYLRYPNAQGTENLQAINVNGAADFNSTVNIDGLTTTTNAINMNGSSTLLNNISTRQLLLKDTVTGTSNNTSISTTSNNLIIDSVPPVSNNSSITLQTRNNLNATISSLILSPISISSPLPLQLNGISGSSYIQTRVYSFYDLNTGVVSNANIYYQSTGLNIDCLTPNSNFTVVTQDGSSVNTNALIVNSTNLRTLTPTIPNPLDSSDKIPTTAWVQSVIPTVTGKTYTVKYTSSQTIQLPVNCTGISVTAVGQGGASGNASNSVTVGLWNAGGSGSAGTTITSNGILPFKEGSFMDIIISNLFGSELYATSLGVTVCRANNGIAGGNATAGAGGIAGVSNNTWIVNNAMTSWNVQIGPSGGAGGTNLAFQSATYPATGGIPICNNWIPSDIHGCGQNWNGITTTNSYQGPAIGILGGAIWITYYLK